MGTLIDHKFGHFREYLRQFVVFTDMEWQLFAANLRFKNLAKKDLFCAEGKICNEIGFIVSGAIRYYVVKDGEQITNYFSFPNELTSAYRSFISREPTIIVVEALEETELITFTYDALQKMYAHPVLSYKMEHFGRKVGEYLLCCYEDRVLSFITQSPEERYMQLLLTGKNIVKQIPQHYIAHFLGITPVSLSRIKRRVFEPVSKGL